jgi:DNA-binding NtrC family response regulator
VVEAEDAITTMQVIDTMNVDMLCADVVMPRGMSAYDLAIRARKDHPHLKILLIIGANERVAGTHRIKQSGFPLLKKPYTMEQLAEMIKTALTRSAEA